MKDLSPLASGAFRAGAMVSSAGHGGSTATILWTGETAARGGVTAGAEDTGNVEVSTSHVPNRIAAPNIKPRIK